MYEGNQSGSMGYGHGGSLGQANVPIAKSAEREIPSAMQRLAMHLQEQEKMIAVLRDRLSGVLRPEPPEVTGTDPMPTPTGLSATINAAAAFVQNNNARLGSLLNRLEL